jgi:hypothetical protein
MELTFEARVALNLDHNKNSQSTKHSSIQFNLGIDKKLERSKYIDENNLPNKDGSFVLSNILVHGLIGNIHMAHDKGYRDSAEHLRWIIGELEKGVATVAEVKVGTFKKGVINDETH